MNEKIKINSVLMRKKIFFWEGKEKKIKKVEIYK